MDIEFASRPLEKQLNQGRAMVQAHGAKRAKRLQIVLTALRAAPTLSVFAPPYSPPHRCHELTGNRKGRLSLDLDGPYRLIIAPAHIPVPQRQEGGLDWARVTAIRIFGVEDTHG
jgi:plasmid maintenance system killer protein